MEVTILIETETLSKFVKRVSITCVLVVSFYIYPTLCQVGKTQVLVMIFAACAMGSP